MIEAGAGATLRVLLHRLLALPGGAASPLYVGPLESAGVLAGALEGAANAAGIPLLGESAAGSGTPGVVLLRADGIGATIEMARGPAAGRQVVLWGAEEGTRLPRPQRRWVEEGLRVDPRALGTRAGREVVTAAARDLAGGTSGPVCLLCPPGAAARTAGELRLRAELEGETVRTPDRAELPRGSESPGVGVVVIAGSVRERGMREVAAWTAGIRRIGVVVEGAECVRSVERSASPGAPEARVGTAAGPRFPLDAVPLAEVLRAAAVWRRSGRIVVYGRHRLGWIQVVDDEMTGAGGFRDTEALRGPDALALVLEMAGWSGAEALLVAEPTRNGPLSGSGIPLDALAFELATRTEPLGCEAVTRPLETAEVARWLCREGLADAATRLLEEARRGGTAGAPELLLLAHLREREGAGDAGALFWSAAAAPSGGEGDEWARRLAAANALRLELEDVAPAAAGPAAAGRRLPARSSEASVGSGHAAAHG